MKTFTVIAPDGKRKRISCEHLVSGVDTYYTILADREVDEVKLHDPRTMYTFPLDYLVFDEAFLHDPGVPGGDKDVYTIEFKNSFICLAADYTSAYTDKACIRMADCSVGYVAMANIPASALLSKINHGKTYLERKALG
jgi:hypothetical protein